MRMPNEKSHVGIDGEQKFTIFKAAAVKPTRKENRYGRDLC